VAPPGIEPLPTVAFSDNQRLVGWREWLALPELGIRRLQCKIDTGARTSALHALDLQTFSREGRQQIRFRLYPLHGNERTSIACTAKISDLRHIRSSNGQRERRYVIVTPMILGAVHQDIEITLADRGPMRFGMLLGRQSLIDGGWRVDPARAFVNGRPVANTGLGT
jgi:hypothetical protein